MKKLFDEIETYINLPESTRQAIAGNKAGLAEMHRAYRQRRDLAAVYCDLAAQYYEQSGAYNSGFVSGATDYYRAWLQGQDLEGFFKTRLKSWEQWAMYQAQHRKT